MGKKKRLKELQRQSKHWLVWLIYGCAVLALATPLLDHQGLHNYVMMKTFPYQILVEIMLVAWVALAIANRKFRPKWNFLNIAMLVFVGAISLSLLFSLDPTLSFWSISSRMQGVVTLLHHAAWFFVLSSVLHERRDWIQLLKMSGLVCFAVVTIIIVRWTGDVQNNVVKSIFGNTSYLASYALPHVFLGLYLWSQEQSYKKYFWLLLTVGAGFTVMLTGSRAGILSLLIAGTIAVVGIALVSELSRYKKVALVSLVVMVFAALIGGFFALRTEGVRSWIEDAGSVPSFVSRLAHRDFGGDRLVLWEMAQKGIAERPVFGWGNEQFAQVSTKYLDIQGPATSVFNESWMDRAHNQYLDHLISYGFVGFLAYLLLWFAVFHSLVRSIRRTESTAARRGILLLGVLFLSYLGYSIFFFDTPQLLMVLFLIMAFTVFLSRENEEMSMEFVELPGTAVIALVLLAIPIAAYSWFAHGELYLSQQHFMKGAAYINSQDWQKSADEFGVVFTNRRNPYLYEQQVMSMEPTRNSIDYYFMGEGNQGGLHNYLRVIADATADAVEHHPHSAKAIYIAGEAHRYLYKFDPVAFDKSLGYIQDYLTWAPDRFDGHVQMAELEILRGNLDEALKWFDSAYERHHKLSRQYGGFILYRKACIYARQRDFKSLARELEQSVKVFPAQKDARLILEMGQVVQPGDNLSGFELYLDETLTYFQKDAEILAAGAKIYHILGHKDMVQQVLQTPALQELMETEDGRVKYEKLLNDLGL